MLLKHLQHLACMKVVVGRVVEAGGEDQGREGGGRAGSCGVLHVGEAFVGSRSLSNCGKMLLVVVERQKNRGER